MNPALWIAKTGLDAQQTRMATVSQNLANVSTTGYKQQRAVFEDLLYQDIRQVGGQTSQDTQLPSGLHLGTGVRVVATEKIFSQGNLMETGNSLDLAIDGHGFFQILMPDGDLAYTRDGTFQRNDQGDVVTSSGYPLQPAISIPEDAQSITVGSDGVVSVMVPGSAAAIQVGDIQIVDFINPTGLQPNGENLFAESSASGAPQVGTPGIAGMGRLQQGFLESSNVNAVEELVNMIETQRAYEMNSKAISTTDQMLAYTNNNL